MATFALVVRRSNHLAIDLIHILIVILLPVGLAGPVLENSRSAPSSIPNRVSKNFSMLSFFSGEEQQSCNLHGSGSQCPVLLVYEPKKTIARSAFKSHASHKYLTNKAVLERFLLYKVYRNGRLGLEALHLMTQI